MSEDVDESDDAETSSAAVRYRWTNDLLAGALIDHLQAYPIARTSKIAETLLLVVLAALYRREK